MDQRVNTPLEDQPLNWRKSGFSNPNGSCFEVAALPGGGAAVRDSKNRGKSPVLRFTQAEMAAWIAGCKSGEFDDLLDG